MADVSHELGSLRFVVESPLSSKVAMFNQQLEKHKQAQLLNPFSTTDGGRVSPKPTFSKDQYGKPLAGSMTEMRGQKANIHVMKEMIELCQIIHSEGYPVKDEPTMRVIPFGELFNIYNYISDKVVGILLRARKHKLLEFEGEMLFQRRDDDVPIFLLRPVKQIREELEAKIDEIKRASSPAPQATSVLLDRSGLKIPRNLKARSLSPSTNKLKTASPSRDEGTESTPTATTTTATSQSTAAHIPQLSSLKAPKILHQSASQPEILIHNENFEEIKQNVDVTAENDNIIEMKMKPVPTPEMVAENPVATPEIIVEKPVASAEIVAENPITTPEVAEKTENLSEAAMPTSEPKINEDVEVVKEIQNNVQSNAQDISEDSATTFKESEQEQQNKEAGGSSIENQSLQNEAVINNDAVNNKKIDINNNSANEMPTVVIEATAVYVQNTDSTAQNS